MSTFISGLSYCMMLILLVFISSNSISAQTNPLPPLKPVNEALNSLRLSHKTVGKQYEATGSSNVQLKLQIELFYRMILALENRPDPNMTTESVILSNLITPSTAHLIVKTSNSIDLDGTISAVLRQQEFIALINTLR